MVNIGKICKSGLGVPTIDETGIGGTKNRRNRKKKMQTVAYGKKRVIRLESAMAKYPFLYEEVVIVELLMFNQRI